MTLAEPEHTVRPDGGQEWSLNGLLHRVGGPAIIYSDGTQEWLRHGRLHRLDGPAYTREDGYQEWWVDGEEIAFDLIEFFKDMGVEDADDETKLAVLRMKMANHA